jgi:hypothetical protein
VSVSVVSVTSISVAVPCCSSYRVGVVIVVCRLFSIMKFVISLVGSSKFMFMSPCMVIEVFGDLVCISCMADWMFVRKSGIL